MTFLESYFPADQASSDHWSFGLDTSSSRGVLSFFNAQGPIKEISWTKEKRHSEHLILVFENEIKQLGLSLKDLSHIFLGLGPGSFTGIRVSCAFVKALAFSSQTPIYGFNSLRLLAAKASKKECHFTVICPSVGELVFATNYSHQTQLIETPVTKALHHSTFDLPVYTDQDFKFLFETPSLQRLDYQEGDFFEALNFSHKNTLFFCNSEYLDLTPLYFRRSEAEEKKENL